MSAAVGDAGILESNAWEGHFRRPWCAKNKSMYSNIYHVIRRGVFCRPGQF